MTPGAVDDVINISLIIPSAKQCVQCTKSIVRKKPSEGCTEIKQTCDVYAWTLDNMVNVRGL